MEPLRQQPGILGMLPTKKGVCQECAIAHDPKEPHNAQSMFYQFKFYYSKKRWPDWRDAMIHCSDRTKKLWTQQLEQAGVNVKRGHISPRWVK